MKRILHVGLGPLGVRIQRDLHARAAGHAVAVVDHDSALAGKSLASLVENASPGVTVRSSLDDVDNWDAIDAAIVTTSSDLPNCMDTLRTLLRRGLTIVSTCEELVYPWLRHVALAEELDELAKAHRGRVLGTGVNPGFLMDALPVFLTSVCNGVRGVEVYRVQDASTRRVPFQQKIGAGLSEDAFRAKVRDGTLRHVGLGESLHFVAHYTGLTVDRWHEDLEPVRAPRDVHGPMGLIPKGGIAGVRQVALGYHDERVVARLEFQAAIGQIDPYDRVVLDADPRVDVIVPGGVHGDVATSAMVLNSLPRLMVAPAGLHTMASIPLTCCGMQPALV